MLNTKFIISVDTARNLKVSRNETACGHAWFVRDVKFAANADAEMQAISSFDPKHEAIVDVQYTGAIDTTLNRGTGLDTSAAATIQLTKYSPDDMVYQSGSKTSK